MYFRLFLAFFTDPTKPKWLGIFYAILLSVLVFGQLILLRTYFHSQFLVGLRFRSAITDIVYRKVTNSYSLFPCMSFLLFLLEFKIIKFIQARNNHWRNYQSSSNMKFVIICFSTTLLYNR